MSRAKVKRGPGRPRLPIGVNASQVIHVRLTRAHARVFRKRGGVQWLRAMLDQKDLFA